MLQWLSVKEPYMLSDKLFIERVLYYYQLKKSTTEASAHTIGTGVTEDP